jgi:protein pelota
LLQHKRKFILAHSSSRHKHALEEIIHDPAIQTRLADAKAAEEVHALEHFYEILGKDDGRAFYDWSNVCKANERDTIETLFVSDDPFHPSTITLSLYSTG